MRNGKYSDNSFESISEMPKARRVFTRIVFGLLIGLGIFVVLTAIVLVA